MKKILSIAVSVLLLFSLISCKTNDIISNTNMKIEAEHSEPTDFIREKAIFISDYIDKFELKINIDFKGEEGIFEIIDVSTGEVFWSDSWLENANETFTVDISSVEKDTEYVLRFTATNTTLLKLTLTTDHNLVRGLEEPTETEKPSKPSK